MCIWISNFLSWRVCSCMFGFPFLTFRNVLSIYSDYSNTRVVWLFIRWGCWLLISVQFGSSCICSHNVPPFCWPLLDLVSAYLLYPLLMTGFLILILSVYSVLTSSSRWFCPQNQLSQCWNLCALFHRNVGCISIVILIFAPSNLAQLLWIRNLYIFLTWNADLPMLDPS